MRGFNKDNIDWKEFASYLLWCHIVDHKNEYSGLDVSKETKTIDSFSIMGRFVPHKHLSWKELALELGLFEEHLTPDGHDCTKCPDEKTCHAYFKYDKDQERCSGWKEEYNNKPEC